MAAGAATSTYFKITFFFSSADMRTVPPILIASFCSDAVPGWPVVRCARFGVLVQARNDFISLFLYSTRSLLLFFVSLLVQEG